MEEEEAKRKQAEAKVPEVKEEELDDPLSYLCA